MFWFLVVVVVVALITSFILGYVFAIAKKTLHNVIGTLRVDNSIPEDGPRLYLELDKDIPTIKQRDYVTLRVNTKNYISHD